MTNKEIETNFDAFLRYYYKQKCNSCGYHNSFWATVIESEEWKKWKEKNNNLEYDFCECEELGILSPRHWQEFIKFIKQL